jgi:DNA-binding GntR family transcriptional regulator
LSREGLVDVFPRRGAFVAQISVHDIRELYEIREAIEGLAARLATVRGDPREITKIDKQLKAASRVENEERRLAACEAAGDGMHAYILQASGNKRMAQFINNYKILLQRERRNAASIPGRIQESYRDHIAIIEAMVSRDAAAAERAMRRHIASTAKSILNG